jgi:cytochrome b561
MTQKYHIISRLIHWTMAGIIIFLLGLGIYMTDFLGKESESRMFIYGLHKSFGVLVLILLLPRLINRLINKPPTLPKSINKFVHKLAHSTHHLLYLLMLIVPLSGYLMSNSFGYPVHLFSIELPFLIGQNPDLGKFFAETHEIAAFTLLGVICFHLAGVIKHRYFEKPENDVLGRMI